MDGEMIVCFIGLVVIVLFFFINFDVNVLYLKGFLVSCGSCWWWLLLKMVKNWLLLVRFFVSLVLVSVFVIGYVVKFDFCCLLFVIYVFFVVFSVFIEFVVVLFCVDWSFFQVIVFLLYFLYVFCSFIGFGNDLMSLVGIGIVKFYRLIVVVFECLNFQFDIC